MTRLCAVSLVVGLVVGCSSAVEVEPEEENVLRSLPADIIANNVFFYYDDLAEATALLYRNARVGSGYGLRVRKNLARCRYERT